MSDEQGFEKTGLGERVATLFVKAFGKSTLGLACVPATCCACPHDCRTVTASLGPRVAPIHRQTMAGGTAQAALKTDACRAGMACRWQRR